MVNAPLSSLAFHERIRRELTHQSDLIPSMPEVVVEALRLINDENSELQQFEDCLRNDGPLVARLLKIVNSPFYGLRNPVTTIKDGVGVLGLRSLRSLVLAAGTANYLERNYSCYGHDNKGLWQHSIVVAAGAKSLCGIAGGSRQDQEELFLAGLLHDIGKLLLGPYLSELNADTTQDEQGGVACEDRLLGIDHQTVGAIIAEKWNLTPMITHTIKHHHDRQSDANCEFAREVAIVRLADWHAHTIGRGYRDGAAPSEPASLLANDLQLLGIPADAWNEARATMDESIEMAVISLSDLTS